MMDAIREQLNRKWTLAILGLVIGLGVGLLYAWQIQPVVWTDATPSLLRSDLRVDYLRMAIDSYSVNRDVDLAIGRYEALGEEKDETLAQVGASPGEVDPTAIQNFSAIVEIMDGSVQPAGNGEAVVPTGESGEVGEPGEEPATEVQPVEQPAPAGSAAMRLLLPVCGATLLLGLLLVGALFLRNRLAGGLEEEPILDPGYDMAEEYDEVSYDDAFPDDFGDEQPYGAEPAFGQETQAAEPHAGPEPLATFRTIYSLGDDRYDDSFSIESPSGDFLGECGVGIGEVMGAGDPKKVSAFEVWLFDKNDIQTVTKVLLSKYAYNDEETRLRLSAKGDPVLAEPGGVVYLDTASLEIEARIVDMTYGQSALPNESFFERMTIELRAMPKA